VTEHKFKIGQLVYFHPKGAVSVRPQLDAVPGPYQITKRLPAAEDGEFQYEIRNYAGDEDRPIGRELWNHSTPQPQNVSKTETHGCIRLTNWDALALAKLVHKGTPVEY
jgi:L,D-transpeptidase catalytic domain